MPNFINIGSAGFSKAERGPIDKNIVFNTVEEMNEYVESSTGTAYPGQIISISDSAADLYKVVAPAGPDVYDAYQAMPIIKDEFFVIDVTDDIIAGLGNLFSSDDPNEMFDYGLTSYAYYSGMKKIHQPLCQYFGFLYKNPETDEIINYQGSAVHYKVLKFRIWSGPNPGSFPGSGKCLGYIIPNIYTTISTQNGVQVTQWYIEYIFKRNQIDYPPSWSNGYDMLYSICIIEDPRNREEGKYPVYVYKLDLHHPAIPEDDVILNVVDLDHEGD